MNGVSLLGSPCSRTFDIQGVVLAIALGANVTERTEGTEETQGTWERAKVENPKSEEKLTTDGQMGKPARGVPGHGICGRHGQNGPGSEQD
jgi:hypothetical protein